MSLARKLVVYLAVASLLGLSIVGPALAILPAAVPILNGFRIVAPLVVGGAARSVPIVRGVPPLTPSAAGVVGTLGVLIAAQTAANFKPRNADHSQVPGADSVPASVESQAATPVTDAPVSWFKASCSPGCEPAPTELEACQRPGVLANIQAGNPTLTGITITGVGTYPQGRACEWSFDGGSWRFPLVMPQQWCPTANAAPSGGVCPTVQQCPSGFTLNGAMCERYSCPPSLTLTGPLCIGERYPVDNIPTIRPAFPGWDLDPLDPDPLPPGQSLPSGNVSTTGPNGDGDPTRVTIEPLPDGGIRVTTEVQHNSGGNTQTTTTIVNISPTGQVGTPIMSNLPGTMPSNPPTSVTPGNTPVGGTGAPGEFPTDYARENTLQGVKQGTDALKADADAAKAQGQGYTAPTLPEGFSTVPALNLPSSSDFTPLDVPTLPGNSSCQPIPMNLLGSSVNLDVCPWVNLLRPLIDAAWLGMCGISAMHAIFRRESH